MAISKYRLNGELKANLLNKKAASNVSYEASKLMDLKSGVRSSLAGYGSDGITAGTISYDAKTSNEQVGYCGIDASIGITGINNINTMTLPVQSSTGVDYTSGITTSFDADSDGDVSMNISFDTALTGLVDESGAFDFSSVSATGGTLDSQISTIIGLLTGLLGSIDGGLSDIAEGGSALDQIKGSVDTLVSEANAKINNLVTSANTAVADVGGALTGVGSGLPDMSALTSQLTTLAAPSSDQIVAGLSAINSHNPAAILNDTVSDFTGNSTLFAEAKNVTNTITSSLNDVTGAMDNVATIGNDFIAAADEFVGTLVNNAISTGQGLLQDISEGITTQASNFINKLVPNLKLSNSELSRIIKAAQTNDEAGIASGIKLVTSGASSTSPEVSTLLNSITPKNTTDLINKFTTKAVSAGITNTEIATVKSRIIAVSESFANIGTTISGTTLKSALDFSVVDSTLSSNAERYKGADTQFDAFTYVDSIEERGAEIRAIDRDVNELIIHATETYTNQNIGAEEIHIDHNNRGLMGIQYHYIIRRDGRLQRGMPVNNISIASDVRGHKYNCIDVVLVGGLNCSTDTENPSTYRSSQSYTQSQTRTLQALLRAFYTVYHGGQVFGHNDLEETASDPYFDVIEYANKVFRKKSVYQNLLTEEAYSSAEIITKRPV